MRGRPAAFAALRIWTPWTRFTGGCRVAVSGFRAHTRCDRRGAGGYGDVVRNAILPEPIAKGAGTSAVGTGSGHRAQTIGEGFSHSELRRCGIFASMDSVLTSTEYRLLVQNSPVMIWRSGVDARCDYFNETWLAFTGRTLEQERGDGWAEGVHRDDFERCVA